jgi:predicted HTH transcriptional regulator
MTVQFGVDSLCRYCKGMGIDRNLRDCLHCSGTGLEPGQKAVTRRSDPETSREAAASISSERLRESQQHVLAILKTLGPLTDEWLCNYLATSMSPSGARTRRAELVARGLVYDTGKRETLASGRKAVVWGAR